jgi:esterase/lipase superfamily enzyme
MLCSAVCAFDVWFVDTRRGFEINQLDNNSKWNRSTLNEFQQSHNPNIPLVIVTHGYKMTYDEAKQFGINFSKLTHNFGEHRFLFWSWDAEKENCGIKSDAINTGKKADAESKYLTNFLKQLKPQSKVSLIGFSYGARLISAAIQNLATEQLQQLKQNTNNKNKITTNLNIRIVFLAAAVDQDQFEQNKKYGNLLQITDKLLVNINAADPALLLYPLLTGIKSPKAAGRYGINTTKIHPKLASKIKSLNVRPDIGIDHTFISSFCAFLKYKNEVKKYALFNDAAK